MDWNFYNVCEAFTMLRMWPVFDIVHYLLMALNMKKDLVNSVSFTFERKHPLASWLTTMLLCHAGAILTCVLLGKPLATILMSPEKIAVSTLVWYVVNYVPGIFTLLTNRWVMCILATMKEVHRIYGIYGGVIEASQTYSSQYLILFMLGIIKGTAAEIMMLFARMSAGVIQGNSQQSVAPNVMFKASTLVTVIFCLEHYTIIQVNHSMMFSCIAAVLIYMRILTILGMISDPFIPFENLFCAVAFGGMWDAYQRVIRQDRKGGANANGEAPSKMKKN